MLIERETLLIIDVFPGIFHKPVGTVIDENKKVFSENAPGKRRPQTAGVIGYHHLEALIRRALPQGRFSQTGVTVQTDPGGVDQRMVFQKIQAPGKSPGPGTDSGIRFMASRISGKITKKRTAAVFPAVGSVRKDIFIADGRRSISPFHNLLKTPAMRLDAPGAVLIKCGRYFRNSIDGAVIEPAGRHGHIRFMGTTVVAFEIKSQKCRDLLAGVPGNVKEHVKRKAFSGSHAAGDAYFLTDGCAVKSILLLRQDLK